MNLLRQLAQPRDDARERLLAANRVLPGLVTPLLVVAIAYELAQLTWTLFPTAAAVPALVGAAPNRAAAPTLSALADSDLFGRSAADAAAAPAPVQDAPDTKLALELKGVLYGEFGQPSAAIISEARGPQNTYHVGDEIDGANGATLHSIYADRVIFERDGALETLRTPREWVGGVGPAARVGQPAPEERADDDASDPVADALAVVAQIVQAVPEYEEDQLTGYRLVPGPDRKTFEALGLRPGDVVTAVNGVAADDPSAASTVTEALANFSGAMLTIKRGGSSLTVPINLAHLFGAPR